MPGFARFPDTKTIWVVSSTDQEPRVPLAFSFTHCGNGLARREEWQCREEDAIWRCFEKCLERDHFYRPAPTRLSLTSLFGLELHKQLIPRFQRIVRLHLAPLQDA